jgi:hypothetical protein
MAAAQLLPTVWYSCTWLAGLSHLWQQQQQQQLKKSLQKQLLHQQQQQQSQL